MSMPLVPGVLAELVSILLRFTHGIDKCIHAGSQTPSVKILNSLGSIKRIT